MNIKKIAINGEKQVPPVVSSTANLTPIASYKISGANRDVQKKHEIDVEENDKLLEFVFDDDTTWMCDAASMHEIFPEVEMPHRSVGGSFDLPESITNTHSERGIFGKIALKLLNVFEKQAIPGSIDKIAERLEDKLMEEGEGLFKLDKDFKLTKVGGDILTTPVLLFIHGTNSNTIGAFGELKGSDVWDFMHNAYKENVFAFQHRTLSKSPLENVLDMVKQLPDAADLHIISHSRGGLVGDVLCRYSLNKDNVFVGFVEDNIDLLKKEGNRENDIKCILELNKAFLNKKIKVKKFIRVACPAAGTKLASNRLDTIMNTFFNLIGGVLNPVGDIIKELIAETIRTKDSVHVLPGLEAQRPDSPFIKILNDHSEDVSMDGNSLMVISGNGKISLGVSGLLVILGKLFYNQRNDLVVNTDSMYLGAKRKGNIQYFFDQGADVNHVKYFLNNNTRQAISLALKSIDNEIIPGFKSVPQYEIPASDRGVFGLEGGDLVPNPNLKLGKRPIAIILPGIMGSNISKKKNKIWVDYWDMVFGGLIKLHQIDDDSISATSLIKTSYKQLADRLSNTYDVVVYPFDWRKQLNDCAKELNDKIVELLKYQQPIKIIGHSMGGVLVRDFIINYEDTFKKLNASNGFKLLYLGSPLGGSFRIPVVLFGADSIIKKLNMLDRRHTMKELLEMFSTFPGILSLLPLTTEGKDDFAKTETWKKMAEAFGDTSWPIPNEANLEVFKNYRDKIIAKRDGIDYTNMVYVAGKDKTTPSDYYTDTKLAKPELVFLSTAEGDQSVTWESGIPKQLIDSNAVYYVDVSHGALPNEPDLFAGIEQILEKGATTLFSKTRPVVRGEEQVFRMPEVYDFDFSEGGIENAIFGIATKPETLVSQIPLSVSVSNGDLAFASYHVLAGHFMNDGILYAEKSIDKNLNNSLSARHQLGIYPGAIGSNTIITTNPLEEDFPGAIIIGLGEPGKLTSYLLTKTVEQGVSKYLIELNGKQGVKRGIGISAILIGSGYGGLAIENSLKAIIEGVNNANKKVIECLKVDVVTVQKIEFIELYEDNSLACLYALTKIESKENRIYNISIGNKKIKKLFGSRKRLPLISTDQWWNRLTIKTKKVMEGDIEVSSLVFNASTSDAREEEKELFSTDLIGPFIGQVSTNNRWDPITAKTLFELMIPNDFKENLRKKGNISWILDKDTAAYPWELLQENITETKPLCIGSGMIRQLSTPNYKTNITRGATEMALVVADPVLNGFVTQLPGAVAEGTVVKNLLTTYGYPNIPLINESASNIILNLFSQDYKIIHLAGHGIFNPHSPKKSGMVIGNDVFLTTAHIAQMSTVPELVFINCCHLGKSDAAWEKYFADRYKLAANLGTELIEMGVKAVVAAGWAVDDRAASDFANIFYSRMFEGYYFGDAVTEARSFIYEKYKTSNNTWGAYQCYGDPFYKLINRTVARKASKPVYIIAEEVDIDLYNLKNKLDTRNMTSVEAIEQLKQICAAIDVSEIRSGEIKEQVGLIYSELGEYGLAVQTFDDLRQLENANFSVSALEKFCNLRGKKCVFDYKSGIEKTKQINLIKDVISELEELVKIKQTSERMSLIGSAYKRKAMVTTNTKSKLIAYNKAASFYQKAFEILPGSYALNNWILLQTVVDIANNVPAKQIAYGGKSKDVIITDVKTRKEKLNSNLLFMDYWELIEGICYDLTLIMIDGGISKVNGNWEDLEKRYKRIWKRMGSKGKKMAELENFEIISDALSLSTTKHSIFLKSKIDSIRQSLENEILEDY